MASWLQMSDYKLLDWGAVPSTSDLLLYHHVATWGGTPDRRVMYVNLPRAIEPPGWDGAKSIYRTCPMRFTSTRAENLVFDTIWPGAYGMNLRAELYEEPLDLSSLTITNVPDGTGWLAANFRLYASGNGPYASSQDASMALRLAWLLNNWSGVPSGIRRYRSMCLYLYPAESSINSPADATQTVSLYADTISILNRSVGFE